MRRNPRNIVKVTAVSSALLLSLAACSSTSATTSGSSASSASSQAAAPSSSAPAFPTHSITFIVPYAPGGGSDAQARRLIPGMEKALGVHINIVYKTGGGGAVGFLQLHSAKPDGYTISNVVVPNIIITAEGPNVGYKPGDFSYIAMTETAPGALVVAKNSKFKSLKQLVDYAKANPGKVTIAGTGSTGKAAVAEIVKATGIKITYVPVSAGVGAIVPDLQGGHVDAAEFASSHVLEHADTLKALGISGSTPSPALPGVPTFSSLGYKGFVANTSWGIMAPPGTPAAIVDTLNQAVEKAVASSTVQAALKKSGLTPLTETPTQAKGFVVSAEQEVTADQKLLPLVGG